MILLYLLPILFLPYLIEVWVETYFELKKKRSLSHRNTAIVRGALMIVIALGFHFFGLQNFWLVMFAQAAIHFMFFNYTYNRITKRPMDYLRDKGIDLLLQIFPFLLILYFQIALLEISVMLYLFA
jgi:hypothetical protein